MKTKYFTFLPGIALCFTAILSGGCSKADSDNATPTALPYSANMADGGYRIFNGVDDCARSGGNCTGDVIIIGNPPRQMLNEQFASMTGNPEKVAAFFKGDEWPTYFPTLKEDGAQYFLERLRSGECDIKRIEYDTKAFYYAGAGKISGEHNEMVIPIIYK
jgi:hypothetical protein